MSLTEYNEAEFIENRRAEGREEGIKEGAVKGRQDALLELVKEGLLSVAVASRKLGVSEPELQKMI